MIHKPQNIKNIAIGYVSKNVLKMLVLNASDRIEQLKSFTKTESQPGGIENKGFYTPVKTPGSHS